MIDKYVAFEGIDGSGKSTCLESVSNYLKRQQEKVHIVKEPYNNCIRDLVLTQGLSNKALSLLFNADRRLLIEKEIIPSLKTGKWVLSDRTFWSTIAYNSMSLNKIKAWSLVDFSIEENGTYYIPKTFFIDTSVEICLDRVLKRDKSDVIENKKDLFKLRADNYRSLCKSFPDELIRIDSTDLSVPQILSKIKKFLT